MARDKKGLTRRGFLKGAALGAGLAALPGAPLLAGQAAGAAGFKMPLRPFGKTGYQVPVLSLGGMFDIPNNQLLLRQAVNLGVTYWDTAESYGRGESENGVGMFLGRFPQMRSKIFLVSKGASLDAGELDRKLAGSLKRLQTGYLDLYFVHSVSGADEIPDEVAKWGKEMKKAGKIKLFGFSTHSNMAECLSGAPKLGWVDGIMFSYNYRIMHEPEMQAGVAACHAAGIGLTAMKTMGGGPVATGSQAELKLAGRFVKQGFTPGQAKLKAIWEDKRIAAICSQMPTMNLLLENAAAALDKKSLTQGDRRALAQYAKATRCSYCAGCTNICQGALPAPLPVGEVMRGLMYARDYGDPAAAAAAFAAIGPDKMAALAAADLGKAEAACPQGLPVASLVRQAAAAWS